MTSIFKKLKQLVELYGKDIDDLEKKAAELGDKIEDKLEMIRLASRVDVLRRVVGDLVELLEEEEGELDVVVDDLEAAQGRIDDVLDTIRAKIKEIK